MKAATQFLFDGVGRDAISIHAAREGGDETGGGFVAIELLFQSTPPVKAATRQKAALSATRGISIHAAREGGDDVMSTPPILTTTISIHAAREGGDLKLMSTPTATTDFNPRRP